LKALDFPLLADENIHPDVIVFLRKIGLNVDSVAEQGKFGLPDIQVLQQATESNRVVLTHDSDFGGMAVFGAIFTGIIYLRPGHIQADFTIKTLEAIRDNAPEVRSPFILVAERTGDTVKIRVRQL
jgi:predicted nuclease of predicted toxin-antitoxin system